MRTTASIEQVDCPMEERLIRSRIKGIGGVERLDFDLVRRGLTVTHGLDDLAPLLDALVSVGMKAGFVTPETEVEAETTPPKAWERRPVVARA